MRRRPSRLLGRPAVRGAMAGAMPGTACRVIRKSNMAVPARAGPPLLESLGSRRNRRGEPWAHVSNGHPR
ncbi:exported hypothetical protein [Nitrosopumilaceae archaeon]|nr:exported hypothetical protein [Nitrosopumilaceae archaeon]